jgi:hypothetical protein
MAMTNNIRFKVESIMKSCINNAKRNIVDEIETQVGATENQELKEALSLKINEVWTSNLVLMKQRSINFPIRKEPIKVKNTPLYLRNVSSVAFKKLCELIASLLDCSPDFSDPMFGNLTQNSRVYEAIRRLYTAGNIHQELLDELTDKAEEFAKTVPASTTS